jgi:pimeloyl-ACP methyl ester carboxylesterase
MDGIRHHVRSPDDVDIGLLSAGSGPPLLLVHGGVGQIERWAPVWDLLAARWRVTAMDRRGRGSSGDGPRYALDDEFGDVAAVARSLAEESGRPVDVFAHSFGATCTIGAAGAGAPFRRAVLYEPPAMQTVSVELVDRLTGLVEKGQAGKAMVSFLMEIIGLTAEEVDALRDSPLGYDILAVLMATLPREGRSLLGLDLATLAPALRCPTRFLLGETTPGWAHEITRAASAAMSRADVVVLPGLGHEAIDTAPDLVVEELTRFLDPPAAGVPG